LVRALKSVDLPTFGRPTIPIERLTGRESRCEGVPSPNLSVTPGTLEPWT
jgi:hypothetical protein